MTLREVSRTPPAIAVSLPLVPRPLRRSPPTGRQYHLFHLTIIAAASPMPIREAEARVDAYGFAKGIAIYSRFLSRIYLLNANGLEHTHTCFVGNRGAYQMGTQRLSKWSNPHFQGRWSVFVAGNQWGVACVTRLSEEYIS